MKSAIEVSSKVEGDEIRGGLKNDKLRAVARMIGILEPFNENDQIWIINRLVDLIGESAVINNRVIEDERR